MRRGPSRLSDDALRHILLELVDSAPEAVRQVVNEGLSDRGVRGGWVRSLTEPELARITYLLEPTHHRILISTAESLFTAWGNAEPRRRDASWARTALWSFVLEVLSRHPEGERSVAVLVREFFAHVGVHLGESAAMSDRREMGERVFLEAVTLAGRTGRARLRAVLSEDRAELMALATAQEGAVSVDRIGPATSAPTAAAHRMVPADGRAPPSPGTPPPPPAQATSGTRRTRQRTAFGMDDAEPETEGEPIHIANAGLVLVAAFLPHLFTTLDVLEEAPTGGKRVRANAVSRMVHLLQYLVDGRTDAPEPLLCLNKVLCGVPHRRGHRSRD